MRKKILIFVPIMLVLSIIGSLAWSSFENKAIGQALPPAFDENFAFGTLNVKARAVNEGGGSTEVTALVDELFDTFSTVVAADVKTRIVASELLYQSNQRDGVEEVEVVEVINGLKLRFDTPEFSKTDLYEVRKLRQALQLLAPQFVAHGRQSEQSFVNNVNPTIVEKMSPAEAVFVTLAMVHQKRSNPNYQLTLSERNAIWNEMHTSKIGQTIEPEPQRAEQFSEAIVDEVATMSPAEILAIPHTALDILGIEQ